MEHQNIFDNNLYGYVPFLIKMQIKGIFSAMHLNHTFDDLFTWNNNSGNFIPLFTVKHRLCLI